MADNQWRNSVVAQVGNRLRERILRQGLRPGDRLPSYRQLAREFDVAYMTVKRGVDSLANDGFVTSVPNKGLFVSREFNHKPKSLGHALLIYPCSMHLVLSEAYRSELARGVLSSIDPGGHGSIRSLLGDGIIYGDYVERIGPDAVFLLGVENDEYLHMAANWGRPVVSVDYCSASVPMDCVACDNRAATRRCVEHLAKLGHRNLAYLGIADSPETVVVEEEDRFRIRRSSDARERREGMREAAAACGLPEPCMAEIPGPAHTEDFLDRVFGRTGSHVGCPPDGTGGTPAPTVRNRSNPVAAGVSPAGAIGSNGNRPTAVVLSGDLIAPRLIRGLEERGLRVPEDVSICAVVGTGVLPECPALTGCKFDFYAMGRKAAEAVRAQIAHPGKPVNRIHRVGFEWVEGRTCGARA